MMPQQNAVLRMELASLGGGGDVAPEIRKRLTAIGKSRSFVDWHKIRLLAADLDMQRSAILKHVAPTRPAEAFDLLWRLPDFDDDEAEQRALTYVCGHSDFYRALGFLMDWPAHGLAADLVLARHSELDGDHYWLLLTPAAEALEQKDPLAATLMLRAMIDFSLNRAKYKRYGHAARHLQTCGYLAKRVEDFGEHAGHDAYVANLKAKHGRKTGFWNA